jgi:hypothetical protein
MAMGTDSPVSAEVSITAADRALPSAGTTSPCRTRITSPGGHPSQQGGKIAGCSALGELLKELTARVHHGHDVCRQRFAEDNARGHGQHGDDVQAEISPPRLHQDLDGQRNDDRDGGCQPDERRSVGAA